jgi:hypothetical protein
MTSEGILLTALVFLAALAIMAWVIGATFLLADGGDVGKVVGIGMLAALAIVLFLISALAMSQA